ncbi:MAG: cell division protein FtsQ/DivIB [Ruminococcus sp.]
MSEKKLSGSQRAKLQKERQKMIREAKKYQKEKKKTDRRTQSGSSVNINNFTSSNKVSDKKRVKSSSKEEQKQKNKKRNIPNVNKAPSNEYGDGFYVDETKQRRAYVAKRQREKQKKQKAPLSPRRRKIRHIVTYSLIFAVVLIIGIVLSLTVLFKTENIKVEGNSLYEEEKIIQLSGVQMEENIFLAQLNATPQKIIDALPYIENARVDFKIPDTITITVKNAEAAYVIISNNQYFKISAAGRILEVSDNNTENLPIIIGSDIKDTQVGQYAEFSDENVNKILKGINNCVDKNGYEGINYIDVTDTANISVIYDNRILIKIGLPEDIDYKLKTAMTIITQKLDGEGEAKASGTLDVSKCNSTKKSYFKDGTVPSLAALPTEATQPQTSQPATTEPATDNEASNEDYNWVPSDEGVNTDNYSAESGNNYSWDNGNGENSYANTPDDNSSVDNGVNNSPADNNTGDINGAAE